MLVPSDNLTNITDRPNYYAGQYLLEDDFELEQQYHIDRLRRHHRLLHIAGIVDGLEVSWADSPTNTKLKVTAGTAIDADGRQIVLSQTRTITEIPTSIAANDNILFIRYESSEFSTQGVTPSQPAASPITGSTSAATSTALTPTEGKNRIKEEPALEWGTKVSPGEIALCRVCTTDVLAYSDRVYSGLRLPSPHNSLGQGLTLRYKGNGQAPKAPGQLELAEFNGNFSITGALAIAGTSALTGNVGIGGEPSTVAAEKLKVTGNTAIAGTLSTTGTNGNLTVAGTSTLNGDTTIAGTLSTTEPDGNLTVSGTSTLNGNTTIAGTLSVTGTSTLTDTVVIGNISGSAGTVGSSLLKVAFSQTDLVEIHQVAIGAGKLEMFGWADGWNINAKTEGKHLYLNRDAGSTSDVIIGRGSAAGTLLTIKGNDGKVGIGTISPTEKLEVVGNIQAINETLTGTLSVTKTSKLTGNVGIGGDPGSTEKLKVTGDATIAGSLSTTTLQLGPNMTIIWREEDPWTDGRIGRRDYHARRVGSEADSKNLYYISETPGYFQVQLKTRMKDPQGEYVTMSSRLEESDLFYRLTGHWMDSFGTHLHIIIEQEIQERGGNIRP